MIITNIYQLFNRYYLLIIRTISLTHNSRNTTIMTYQIYRNSTLGNALQETINELIKASYLLFIRYKNRMMRQEYHILFFILMF